MMPQLINLIYGSSVKDEMTESELIELLTAARVKNRRLGVTGMLLYQGGNFLQVLEGEKKVVEDLYTVIEYDPRHRHIALIAKRVVQQRVFGQWEMGFVHLNNTDPLTVPGYSDFMGTSIASDSFRDGNFAYAFLQSFKEGMR